MLQFRGILGRLAACLATAPLSATLAHASGPEYGSGDDSANGHGGRGRGRPRGPATPPSARGGGRSWSVWRTVLPVATPPARGSATSLGHLPFQQQQQRQRLQPAVTQPRSPSLNLCLPSSYTITSAAPCTLKCTHKHWPPSMSNAACSVLHSQPLRFVNYWEFHLNVYFTPCNLYDRDCMEPFQLHNLPTPHLMPAGCCCQGRRCCRQAKSPPTASGAQSRAGM